MLARAIALHSVPYIVGIAGSIVAANEIVRPTGEQLRSPSDISVENAITFGQAANRSTKADRLPIRNLAPLANDKGRKQSPPKLTPSLRSDPGCRPPIDLAGHCFANTEPHFNVAQIDSRSTAPMNKGAATIEK